MNARGVVILFLVLNFAFGDFPQSLIRDDGKVLILHE